MDDSALEEQAQRLTAWFTSTDRQSTGTFLGPQLSSFQPEGKASLQNRIALRSSGDEAAVRSVGLGLKSSSYFLIGDADSGTVAIEDIRAEGLILRVSRTDVLNFSNSHVSTHISREKLKSTPPYIKLVLALLYESGQGGKGKWWPYLQTLPTSSNTLINWTLSELAELQASHVKRRIGREEADAAFDEYLWPVVREHHDLFTTCVTSPNDSMNGQLDVEQDIAHQTASLVMACAFDLDEESSDQLSEHSSAEDGLMEDLPAEKGMVPFADMIREHPDEHNVRVEHGDDGSIEVIATSDIKAGQELLQDFGQLPNSELLRCYGLVSDAHQKYDIVGLDVHVLGQAARDLTGLSEQQVAERIELAEAFDVCEGGFDLGRNPEVQPIEEDLLITTKLLTTTDDAQLKALRNSKKRPKPRLEKENALLLASAIEKRQKEYLTTIAEDQIILQRLDRENSKRTLMAVQIRLAEKQILAENLQYIRSFAEASTLQSNDDKTAAKKARR